ncbi:MAG: histidinol-phosphate transaminase [Kiritimatiellae bacterium]|nr:histidinol-phosphate transaminase [Kiritimatiellia bacterium]
MMKYIRESVESLTAYTPGEQPKDPSIIKLNTNENPYPPSSAVSAALADIDVEALRLYSDPLSVPLRCRLAEMHDCAVSQVFAGNGSDEVLALCTRAFVENDGSIGFLDPSYSLYSVLADIRHVEQRRVSLGENFSWHMPEGFEASLFFLTNPNAPTGVRVDKDVIQEFCKSFNGVVVIDEAYVDFADADCMDLALSLDNVIVCRTLSKSFSLAGLRLGYAVGCERLIEALMKVKDSYNLGMLPQLVALAALSDLDHMRANVDCIRATRERLTNSLVALGFDVLPSDTNFLMVRPPVLGAAELFETLREQGILVRYFPGERTGDYIRITVGTDDEVDRLLISIESILAVEKKA